MISNRHPYFKPPQEVAVFAYLAGESQGTKNGFVPAGMLENISAVTSPTFVYGRRYVLSGLSEFGGIRDAAPDAWGRRVIENKLKTRAGDLPEVAYLLEAGSDRVGALDIRWSRNSIESTSANQEVELQRLLEVADKIENDEPVPEHLFHYFSGLGSVGGARPKATVRDEDGILWLAKFPSKGDRACNAVLEGGALELARSIGLRVPPVKIQEVGDKRVLLIRRFDRYWAEQGSILAQGEESWVNNPGISASGATLEEGRIGFCSAMTLDNALSRWSAFHGSRRGAVEAIYQVWLACREWMQHFEKLNASELDMQYLTGAFRRLEDLASMDLVKELRGF